MAKAYIQDVRERGLALVEEGTADGEILEVLGRSDRIQCGIRRAADERERPPDARDVPAKWFKQRVAHYAHFAAGGHTLVIRGRGLVFILFPPEERDEFLIALDGNEAPSLPEMQGLLMRLELVADSLNSSALRFTSSKSGATDIAQLGQRLAILEKELTDLKAVSSTRVDRASMRAPRKPTQPGGTRETKELQSKTGGESRRSGRVA